MRRPAALILAAASLLAAAPASAGAASTLVIDGAGFGHGVGMSQYGALGYARHGWTAPRILAHYYTGTKLARLTSSPTVRVLLQSGRSVYTVRGVAAANGTRMDPAKAYRVRAGGQGLTILAAGAHRGRTTPGMFRLRPAAGGTLTLDGTAANGVTGGAYRGALEFRRAAGGLQAVNALGLESYVAGVVAAEVPASWPTQALRTQAIAARTYAITSNVAGAGFTQYADTRSQMYRGVSSETPATSAAVLATRSMVVTYQGTPVTTYFFSSSGGQTENVENVFLGGTPQPWLKGVKDPYDTVSPYHRWGPIRLSLASATAKLGSLVQGRLQWIRVLARGVSPRIVSAQLVGSLGTTTVTGPQLRRAFGLRDAWMTFKSFSTDLSTEPPAAAAAFPGTATDPSAAPVAHAAGATPTVLTGSVQPATAGAWATVQRAEHGRWVRAADVQLGDGGTLQATLPGPGRYRVTYAGLSGPAVTAR